MILLPNRLWDVPFVERSLFYIRFNFLTPPALERLSKFFLRESISQGRKKRTEREKETEE